jgi:hypothetical protein
MSKSDVEIVKRARQILDSSEKWNRTDHRNCPDSETKFSLYCALEKATSEVAGDFAHRDAAMQEARSKEPESKLVCGTLSEKRQRRISVDKQGNAFWLRAATIIGRVSCPYGERSEIARTAFRVPCAVCTSPRKMSLGLPRDIEPFGFFVGEEELILLR